MLEKNLIDNEEIKGADPSQGAHVSADLWG